ncbi:MAG: NUDIX domain-containing protein [Chromatiales bacterium]|jgi:ADP-ribose pyrophosphatase
MDWEIINRILRFDGFFRVFECRLRHRLFGGEMSPELVRELIDRGRAVAVLPYDPRADAVVLIEQFRIGAIDAPAGPWQIELIAGLMEPGEGEESVARREAEEEAGCTLGRLERIHDFYSSPGSTSERVAVYVAEVDSAGLGGIHGIQDEGEDIRVHVVSVDQALAMLRRGRIDSAIPIIALQWLALNRDSLHRRWSRA